MIISDCAVSIAAVGHRCCEGADDRLYFTLQGDSRISAKCRDAKVEDLWSLTSFFGYSTQTFVLAVNLLDRFLAMMRVREAHMCSFTFIYLFKTHNSFLNCYLRISDPAEAPLLRQPQLPPHGGQSDGGGVQPDAHRRAHPHRTVQVHRVRPLPHGEDRRGEARLQVQSRHCLNVSAPVPPDRTFPLHRQVRRS